MSEFEDNLWVTVVREHGDELAHAERSAHTHRRASCRSRSPGRPRVWRAIAPTSAAALLFGASTSPPAFAVTRNPDGTVTVNLIHQSGIAGANKKLAATGGAGPDRSTGEDAAETVFVGREWRRRSPFTG